MSDKITYCIENPIKTDLVVWMNAHLGRVSVGKKCEGYYEILAYSDRESDFPELHRLAKKNRASYINSVISEGVTAID